MCGAGGDAMLRERADYASENVFLSGGRPSSALTESTALHRPERGRAPPQLLIARAPACDAARTRFEARHHTPDPIRRLATHAQFGKDVQAMEREASADSFPASDAPGWSGRRLGMDRCSSLKRHITIRFALNAALDFRATQPKKPS